MEGGDAQALNGARLLTAQPHLLKSQGGGYEEEGESVREGQGRACVAGDEGTWQECRQCHQTWGERGQGTVRRRGKKAQQAREHLG